MNVITSMSIVVQPNTSLKQFVVDIHTDQRTRKNDDVLVRYHGNILFTDSAISVLIQHLLYISLYGFMAFDT